MSTALPFQAQQPIFGKMGGISELSHLTQEERRRYVRSRDKYRDALSVMRNERNERSVEIARMMRQGGEPIEKIALYTGLSKDTIERL